MESSTDFERAKNFWQTREANVLSEDGEVAVPLPVPVPVPAPTAPKEDPPAAAPAAAASRRYSAPVASLGAVFRRRAKSKLKNSKTGVDEDAATDDDEGEVEEEGEPEPAASSKTINIKNMKTSMLKTMRSVSVSGRSSNTTTASDDHEDESDRVAVTGETSREGSPSSAAAQPSRKGLGDVVSWKMKMRLKGKAASARINLTSLATSWKNPSGSNSTDSSPAGGAHAAEPVDPTQNIHCPCTRPKTNNAVIPTGSPYGEVVLVDLVAARNLESAQGESDVYVSLKLDAAKRKSHVIEQTLNPVFNERFVFWVPSSPSIELQNLRIILHSNNADEEHLGEVHLSLAIPMNESFDDWYPLIKLDGAKKAAVRINVRRTVLVSPSLQEAAQKLSAWERSLNNGDYETYSSTIPAVWAEIATDSSDATGKHSSDVITSKLNNLSRRFIGIELTSHTERRDVF